jgi:outer membrane protein insertion porin family
MRNKIRAFVVTVSIFVAINAAVMAEGNYTVGDITFSNLKELPGGFLETKLPVKTGDSYSNKSLSDIYLALKNLGYVSNVNIYPTIAGEKVNLVIEVDEANGALNLAKQVESKQDYTQKTEFKVTSVEITGAKNTSDYISKIPAKVGEYFVPQDVLNGAKALFETGYFESVDPKVERKADNTVSINYVVVENPIISKVSVSGQTLYTEEQLKEALGIKEGEILNGNLLDPQNNGIIKKYNADGYSLARVENIKIEKDGALLVSLTEGIVTGISYSKVNSKKEEERRNPNQTKLRTQNYVFERVQKLHEGQVYNKENVEGTIRELYRTGLFTSIEPVFKGGETNPNARTVEFLVEERPTASINGSISYGTSVGIVGGIKFSDTNFMGKGQEATFNVEVSNKGNKTAEIGLFDPWIKGTDRLQGGWSVYWKESKDEDAVDSELMKVRKIGTRLTLGKGLNDKIYVRTALRFENVREQEADQDVREKYNLVAVTPSIIYDTRNNSFNPQSGIYSTASYEYGELISDPRSYSQVELDLRAYHRTFFKDANVMAYRAVWGYTGAGTPESLRFSVGGAESIRGYDSGAFDGYNKFHLSIENRTQVNKFMQIVGFFDMGNAWQTVGAEPDRESANQFKDLKKGVGVGVRLNTPVGPLRFDYGWPLDAVTAGEKKESGKFYFSFGQTF